MKVEPNPPDTKSNRPGQISLFSFAIFGLVVATLGLSFGLFFRSIDGNSESMGAFILVTSMAPLLLLSLVSLVFRVLKYLF